MPESLQQKVDRMTAGMEVTVTFGGPHPVTMSGATWSWTTGGKILEIGTDTVRFGDGSFPATITAIDMPDPECPFEMGARVVSFQTGNQYIVDGWEWSDVLGCWAVKVPSGNRIEPGYLRLVPPELAEPDCLAILVTYTDGGSAVFTRHQDDWRGQWGDRATWLTLITLKAIATVQALRPAEYLRGGA